MSVTLQVIGKNIGIFLKGVKNSFVADTEAQRNINIHPETTTNERHKCFNRILHAK
jgi:hypothetical protein